MTRKLNTTFCKKAHAHWFITCLGFDLENSTLCSCKITCADWMITCELIDLLV